MLHNILMYTSLRPRRGDAKWPLAAARTVRSVCGPLKDTELRLRCEGSGRGGVGFAYKVIICKQT